MVESPIFTNLDDTLSEYWQAHMGDLLKEEVTTRHVVEEIDMWLGDRLEEGGFLFRDHPMHYDSWLEEFQSFLEEENWKVDMPRFEYLFKRNLYTHVSFGLGLKISPKTPEEIEAFEKKYLQEDKTIVAKSLALCCSVELLSFETIGGNKQTLYMRKWESKIKEP